MIRGIGIDLTTISRMEKACEQKAFLNNVFTETERVQAGDPKSKQGIQSLAARFAAKEAFAKAVGTGFVSFQPRDIEVIRLPGGAPSLRLGKDAEEAMHRVGGNYPLVSITHEEDTAAAVVIIEE